MIKIEERDNDNISQENNEIKRNKIVNDPYNIIRKDKKFIPVNKEDIINKEATENFQIPLDLFLQKKKELESTVTIRLPSISKLGYDEIVKLKPLYTKHQKILAKTPYFSRLPVYIDILRDRVEFSNGMPINPLILGKRDFDFLLGLYQSTISQTLDFTVTCGNCETENKIKINIEKDLEINELKGPVQIECLIYNDSVKVIFEIPRVINILNVYEYLMKANYQVTEAEFKLHEMAECMKEVYLEKEKTIIGFQNFEEKLKFLNELNTEEIQLLEEEYDKFDYGIKLDFNFTCSKCKFNEILQLPIRTEFDFFQLNEIEKIESILESQFLLAKTAGINLSDSEILDPSTRNLLIKIVNDFYQKINEARNSN